MKVSDLKPNPRNPRKITDKKLGMLGKSMDQFGDLSGFVFNQVTSRLVGGHQRGKIVPPDAEVVIEESFDPPTPQGTVARGYITYKGEKFSYREVRFSEETERAANIAANKHGGEFDHQILADDLIVLDNQGVDLELAGFTVEETEQIVAPTGEPKAKAPAKPPEVEHDGTGLRFRIDHGDCLEGLRQLDSESVHSVVTDPPAGISFMNKDWDSDRGGRDQWIAWLADVMRECLRVLKPGGHALVWALPRTSHWTATAVENAGFEVRDVLTHLFGQGFPKSMDVSKAITTPEAKQWDGWGTALKPAVEKYILAKKPFVSVEVDAEMCYSNARIGALLCRLSNAKFAARVSELNPSALEPRDSVRWLAAALSTLASLEESDVTAMFKSQGTDRIFLSIARLWSEFLVVVSEKASTFTTETKTSLTTDLKILNACLSLIMHDGTTQDGLPGSQSGASIATSLLNEIVERLNCTLIRFVPGRASTRTDSSGELTERRPAVAFAIPMVPFGHDIILARKPLDGTVAETVPKTRDGGAEH